MTTSPITIDLSDSESGVGDDNVESECQSSQPEGNMQNWIDQDYMSMDCNEIYIDDVLTDDRRDSLLWLLSSSSGKTEIYVPTIDTNAQDHPLCDKKSSPIKTQTRVVARKPKEERLEKQREKLQKQAERGEKKQEKLRQKRMRAALAQKHKYLKPEESIKLLRINIDTRIVNSGLGGVVINSLQQSGLQYYVGDQVKPFTICWSKTVKDVLVSEEGVVQEDISEVDENQLLYIMNSSEVVRLVSSGELLAHVETIKSMYVGRVLTVVIIGMQKYFNDRVKKMKFSQKSGMRKGSVVCEGGGVSKQDLQSALIELQFIGQCNHMLIETGEELASLVMTTTKSLSQIGYKLEKEKRREGDLDWFAEADSKQSVKVDKEGNGLANLWRQQMCQFSIVGLDMASAIASSFESPRALVEAYAAEGELLLQNIHMRRNAGILSTTRRVGPEASRKLHRFYMSDDPDLEL